MDAGIMGLSTEVKGYIVDNLATKIASWDKIKAFGLRIGVDTADLKSGRTKREACEYIMNSMPKENAELSISTFFTMSKLGGLDKDYSKQVLEEINPLLERTMQCRLDESGKISMIFPLLEPEPSLIGSKLTALGFKGASASYEQALKAYRASLKGSVALLRSAIDSLTEEILKSKGITPTANFKDRLPQLANLNILISITSPQCPHCQYKRLDAELNNAYALYGILSHYGSHTGSVDDAVANFLYTSTSAFVWLVINRC